MRNTEACPGCGARIQRDAESAGCPSVTCPVCGTSFHCFTVQSDFPRYLPPLSVSVQYHIYRLLDSAGNAASEMENTRKQLAGLGSTDILCTLSSAFTNIADGRLSITISDLLRAFASHDISLSEQELTLLRNRYGQRWCTEVSFAEFVRQLTPRT